MTIRHRIFRNLVLAAVALWLVLSAGLVLSAFRDLRDARAVAESSFSGFQPQEALDGTVRGRVDRVRNDLERADSRLSSPILAPWRVVPVLGRQLRAVSATVGSAAELGTIASRTLAEIEATASAPLSTPEARLAAIERIHELVSAAVEALRRQELGPDEKLFPPVADLRNDVSAQIADADQAMATTRTATAGLMSLLRGPRRYLVFAANNAEMRAGSGMFLSIGILDASAGQLRLSDMTEAEELMLERRVDVGDDLERLWGWTALGRDWRDLGLSPRFAPNAELASKMWEARTGEAVDGAIAVDIAAMQALLAATGPVSVGGIAVTEESALEFLLHDQYVDPVGGSQSARRDLLGELAVQVIDEVQSGDVSAFDLASSLVEASRGRHILAWAADPQAQAAWTAMGIDGELSPDSLLLSVLNRGGNKLDWFLGVQSNLTHRRTPAGTDVAVEVVLDNGTPRDEVPYIAGPHPDIDAAPGDYIGFVSLHIPAAATAVEVEGGDVVSAGRDGPADAVAAQVVVARGNQTNLTFRFRLPPDVTHLRVEPSARIPLIRWTDGATSWRDRGARVRRL